MKTKNKQKKTHNTPKLADCFPKDTTIPLLQSPESKKACATEELTCNCHVKAWCSYTFTL